MSEPRRGETFDRERNGRWPDRERCQSRLYMQSGEVRRCWRAEHDDADHVDPVDGTVYR